jgi:serine/threonine protein kinase
MGFWESNGESADDYLHASLHYDDVASSGPAARPLEFPTPTVHSCERIELVVKDHRSGTVHRLRNVIMKHDSFGVGGDTAYLVKKKLAKSVYGSVRLCIVLKRCRKESQQESREDAPVVNSSEVAEWESTDTRAVVKASSWSRIHAMRGRHLEDPIKEIAAMQHLGNYNPHVLGAREVLQDDTFLYTVMKYLPNGDLYGRLVGDIQLSSSSEDSESDSHGLNEKQIRVWFRQLLLVSLLLFLSTSLEIIHWNWN